MIKKDSATRTAFQDSSENGPLYRRLAWRLKEDIITGTFPMHSMLPTEQDLCERFGASRYTVREALRILEEGGLVERRQGRGTEVISDQERPVFAQSLTSLSQLYEYAADTRLVIDRVLRIVPDEELAAQLGRSPGREWLLAEGLRTTSKGESICVTRVFVHQDFAEIAPDLKTHLGAIHGLIESRFGVRVEEVHQEISTVSLEVGMAAQLGKKPGGLAILVTRRYLARDDRPLLVSLNWHRPDNFRYGQIIRRE